MATETAVVIDPGSFTVKAGVPGDRPSAVLPTLVARERRLEGRPDYGRKCGVYLGHDAEGLRGACQISYPIVHGFVENWDDFDRLLRHTLVDRLRVVPDDHPLLITENPRNPKGNTEKTAQIALEEIGVPCLSIQNTSVLSLLAQGLETGLVIGLGEGDFTVSPIKDRAILSEYSPRIPWGGRFITDFLKQQIMKEESEATPDQRDSVKMSCFLNTLHDIKHTCCFVSQDYEHDLKKRQNHGRLYEMPDGTDLKLSYERFVAPEAVFNPRLLGLEMYDLPRQISDAMSRAEDDVRRQLLSNVVICGGSSLFPGLVERFHRELEHHTGEAVNVVATDDRQYSAWIGGAKFASAARDPKHWLSKEEYDEHGPTRIFSKGLA